MQCVAAVGVAEVEAIRELLHLDGLGVHLVFEDELLEVEERPLVVGQTGERSQLAAKKIETPPNDNTPGFIIWAPEIRVQRGGLLGRLLFGGGSQWCSKPNHYCNEHTHVCKRAYTHVC